ncbi:uncharacterized protein LOC102804831 [Saccoglossus kowalevskii]|uniref:Neuropilin and tolloid-like protein 1-like n=1 Tax=Saccoglossus kowalevskii TaxID=10224 RepID=A0ABM0MLL2_SACKO|nr:PREDICTED: neuropilin and tolloid-like protein 1-like [Saccoglossus kowalevskii]
MAFRPKIPSKLLTVLLFAITLRNTVRATVYMSERCDDVFTIPGERLASQRDAAYSEDMDCTVKIEAPEGKMISVQFEWLDIEARSVSSCYDYLDVFDGPSTYYSPHILRICGTSTPGDLQSTGDSLTIRLKTDATGNRRGFSLIFTAFGTGTCEGEDDFSCDGHCIDKSLVCDCNYNCIDKEDEVDCPPCKAEPIDSTAGLSVWDIIVVVVGTLIFVVIVTILAVYVYLRLNKMKKRNKITDADMTTSTVTMTTHVDDNDGDTHSSDSLYHSLPGDDHVEMNKLPGPTIEFILPSATSSTA